MSDYDVAVSRRQLIAFLSASAGVAAFPALAQVGEVIVPQPFFASVTRVLAALIDSGQPVARADADRLVALIAKGDAAAVAAADEILNRYTLARVLLDAKGIGLGSLGGADRTLVEQGWRSFLVRVSNPYGLTDKFDVSAGGGAGRMSVSNSEMVAGIRDTLFMGPLIEKLWIVAQMQAGQPLTGASVEYQVIDLYSRDRGERRGRLAFGAGFTEVDAQLVTRAQSISTRARLPVSVVARPTDDVVLSILDSDGQGCMASLIIQDALAHIYPPQVMRLAPDMFFHQHIYRADGETVRLPEGEYSVTAWRGPEYVRRTEKVRVTNDYRRLAVRLERWIDPTEWRWYSGDTHIHASGCAHYMHPTEGVTPETMIRQVRGEGLAIANVLTWGPGWYSQKQYNTGHAISPPATLEHPELQAANNITWQPRPTPKDQQSLIRYDIEASKFPSSLSGHVILLRLQNPIYPGTSEVNEWPSWTLPLLKFGRSQGALCGFAHCGNGMRVSVDTFPNYEIPPFDGIGTNEAIVDVTHDAVDFLSGCEMGPAQEFNAWYHMLNCGFRLAMVGETDYPCLSGERPGVGRSYVQLDHRPMDDAGYNAWIEGIRKGRYYCGDGRSHFLNFEVDGRTMGETVELARGTAINVIATVAARIEPVPTDETRAIRADWHIERARIGETRKVPLELVVNGEAVERIELLADGKPHDVRFKTRIERSSWVALRIMPSGHTHPVFVSVGGRPIRASRRSAEWLRKCVDAIWTEKHRMMRDGERPAAAEAYDHARRTYDRIMSESDVA